MRLDADVVRYLTDEDMRLLWALERCMMGTPESTANVASGRKRKVQNDADITAITRECNASAGAPIRPGAVRKGLVDLARRRLVSCESGKGGVEGGLFRLTYAGYDAMALQKLASIGVLSGVGRKLGVGKESDIYLGLCDADDVGVDSVALKFHRLGRTSFRSLKNNRDYTSATPGSICWLWMSREAAAREFAFMQALWQAGLAVPKPVGCSRHLLAMEYVGGSGGNERDSVETARLFANVRKEDIREWAADVGMSYVDLVRALYDELMEDILLLARHGLIHGDFNEFNLMLRLPVVNSDGKKRIVMIDFPQMLSTKHPDAGRYFSRDVDGVRAFFARRFGYGILPAAFADSEASEMSSLSDESFDESSDESISDESVIDDAAANHDLVVEDVPWPRWENVQNIPRIASLDADLRASGWRGVVGGSHGNSRRTRKTRTVESETDEDEIDEDESGTEESMTDDDFEE